LQTRCCPPDEKRFRILAIDGDVDDELAERGVEAVWTVEPV